MGAGRIGVKLRGAGAQAAPGVEDSADGLLPEKGKYTLQQTTVGLLSTSSTGSVLQTLYRHPHPMHAASPAWAPQTLHAKSHLWVMGMRTTCIGLSSSGLLLVLTPATLSSPRRSRQRPC